MIRVIFIYFVVNFYVTLTNCSAQSQYKVYVDRYKDLQNKFYNLISDTDADPKSFDINYSESELIGILMSKLLPDVNPLKRAKQFDYCWAQISQVYRQEETSSKIFKDTNEKLQLLRIADIKRNEIIKRSRNELIKMRKIIASLGQTTYFPDLKTADKIIDFNFAFFQFNYIEPLANMNNITTALVTSLSANVEKIPAEMRRIVNKVIVMGKKYKCYKDSTV